MNTPQLPKVSALMGAYNYAQYIVEAIVSAMEQDYPPERLELIVVDDGSTDNTAELVRDCMDRYPGRITLVQQPNSGATAATNRARAEATGDLMALLDADDVWLPDKTRRQVAMMMANPELGLTWTRMQLVDGVGRPLFRGYGYQGPIPENQFARVLWENVAVQSSLIIDADLFDPMPADAPYADWWLTLRAAQFKKIDYIPEDLVLYRWHGANITGGVGGVKALREAQKGIAFQRWVLREFDTNTLSQRLTPADMGFVWGGLENQAEKGITGLRSRFGVLANVSDNDRNAAAANAEAALTALDQGDLQGGCLLLLRARACDPYDMELRDRFEAAVAAAEAAAKLPNPLDGSQGFVILTDAEFLLADDAHLSEYAHVMRGVPDVTLVIDASRIEPETAASSLSDLVQRCGLADDDLSLLGIIGPLAESQRFQLLSETRARYGSDAVTPERPERTPRFTTDRLVALRELAEQK